MLPGGRVMRVMCGRSGSVAKAKVIWELPGRERVKVEEEVWVVRFVIACRGGLLG